MGQQDLTCTAPHLSLHGLALDGELAVLRGEGEDDVVGGVHANAIGVADLTLRSVAVHKLELAKEQSLEPAFPDGSWGRLKGCNRAVSSYASTAFNLGKLDLTCTAPHLGQGQDGLDGGLGQDERYEAGVDHLNLVNLLADELSEHLVGDRLRVLRLGRLSLVVAVQVEFESKKLEPGYHFIVSRVETRPFQSMGQLHSTCTAPPGMPALKRFRICPGW